MDRAFLEFGWRWVCTEISGVKLGSWVMAPHRVANQVAPMFPTIVCVVDAGDKSQWALQRAGQLAEQNSRPLKLIRIIEPMKRGIDSKVQEVRPTPAFRRSVSREPDIERVLGLHSEEIETYVKAHKGALLVLGCPSGKASSPFAVIERLLSVGAGAVLAVNEPASRSYRRVVVGLELSPMAKRLVSIAAELAPDGDLSLLHAYHVPFSGFMSGRDTCREFESWYRKTLEGMIGGNRSASTPAEPPQRVSMVMGEARRVLKAEVTRCDAELLVVGTHPRSRLSRAVCGSVGGELTASVSCDTCTCGDI